MKRLKYIPMIKFKNEDCEDQIGSAKARPQEKNYRQKNKMLFNLKDIN